MQKLLYKRVGYSEFIFYRNNKICLACLIFGVPKYSSEDQSCKRSDDNKLQWECHNEVSAVGCKVVRQETAGEAIAMVYAKHTCKQNLPDYGEKD